MWVYVSRKRAAKLSPQVVGGWDDGRNGTHSRSVRFFPPFPAPTGCCYGSGKI